MRPYQEFSGLAYQAAAVLFDSYIQAAARQAGGGAGPAARMDRRPGPASPAGCWDSCWLGRDGRRRPRPGSSSPKGPSEPRPSPPRSWGSIMTCGVLELGRGLDAEALVALQAAEPLARRLALPDLTSPGHGLRWSTPWCGRARPSAPRSSWPGSTARTANTERSASPLRRCGSPKMTPGPPSPSSPRSWPGQSVQLVILADQGVRARGGRQGRARRSGRRRSALDARSTPPNPTARDPVPAVFLPGPA